MNPEDVIKMGASDSLNQVFKDGAELVIIDGKSGYISMGSSRYYFAGR